MSSESSLVCKRNWTARGGHGLKSDVRSEDEQNVAAAERYGAGRQVSHECVKG